jgi:uncharacterized protein (TIGR03000 family)
MRKITIGLGALAVASLLLLTNTAQAQRRGGGGWGGGGGRSSWGVSVGTPGFGAYYGSGYNRGWGYGGYGYYGDRYYRPGYSAGYYPRSYGDYGYSSYPSDYGYSSYYPSYDSSYSAPAPAPEAAATGSLNLEVHVPVADAKISVNGQASTQRGMTRWFTISDIAVGRPYRCEVRASWMEGGREVTQTRVVTAQAGETAQAVFNRESATGVAPVGATVPAERDIRTTPVPRSPTDLERDLRAPEPRPIVPGKTPSPEAERVPISPDR